MSNLFSFNLSFYDILGIPAPTPAQTPPTPAPTPAPTPPTPTPPAPTPPTPAPAPPTPAPAPTPPTPAPAPTPALTPELVSQFSEYYIKNKELQELSVEKNTEQPLQIYFCTHSFTGIDKMETIFTKLNNFKKNVLENEQFNHIIDMKKKNYRTIYITSDIHADIRKLLKLLIDEGIISITPNKNTNEEFDPYTDHIYNFPFIDNINFLKSNMLFIILGDLVDGGRANPNTGLLLTKVDDPRGNFELILHIFLFNMRLKAREKHSEVLFTLGNHDFANIILNKDGKDILYGYRHSANYFYIYDDKQTYSKITNTSIYYNVFCQFYDISPYIMLLLVNDEKDNQEFKCIHASFNHRYSILDNDDKTAKLLVLQENINKNGLTAEFTNATSTELLGTNNIDGLLWSRFYTSSKKKCKELFDDKEKTQINTTIVVGHCPTSSSSTRINRLEDTKAQQSYDGCAGIQDVNDVSGSGCVVADCFNNGIPKLIFVDTMMSQAFYEGNDDTKTARSNQTCEFLLLEHDTTLTTLNTSSGLDRWINKISRKPAGYDAQYLYQGETKTTEDNPILTTTTTRATIFDFICAQENQIDNTISEITNGNKTTDWIWYILPSDLDNARTANALFFHLGPNAKTDPTYGSITISIEEYLDNKILRDNYMKIITAIYDSMKDNIIIISDTTLRTKMCKKIDYDKLQLSLINFTPILIAKLKLIDKNNETHEYDDFIEKIKILHNVVNPD
jgi:hypothetical protein